jgi:molybdate transport system ATP-binding protein
MSAEADVLTVDCGVTLGDFALDVQFTAGPGITVLFGPSGAGKTTILSLVAGLIRPDRGRIVLDGDVLADAAAGVFVPAHQRRIGLVFQDAQLFPHLTVAQNLAFGGWFNPRSNGLRAETVVDVLGIGHLLERRPARLSGGEKSRVALARALLSSPRFLLMDEPLSALDEEKRQAILPLVERVRDEFGVPMLYVTHAREEAVRLAQRVVRVDHGRVVADGAAV